jgi:hypothetical protein
MTSLEDRIARLEDRAGILETIHRYTRGIDHDREMFASVWADDAVYRVDEPFGDTHGKEAIVATWDAYRIVLPEMYHHTANVLIDGPDSDHASAVSESIVFGRDGEGTAWLASSTYSDKLRKIDGQWLFTERYDHVNYLVPWNDLVNGDGRYGMYFTPEVMARLLRSDSSPSS